MENLEKLVLAEQVLPCYDETWKTFLKNKYIYKYFYKYIYLL